MMRITVISGLVALPLLLSACSHSSVNSERGSRAIASVTVPESARLELNRLKESLRVDDTDLQEGLCPVRDAYDFPEFRKKRGEFYSLAYKSLHDHLSSGPVCGFKLQSSYCLGKLIQFFVLRNRAGKQVVMYNPYDEFILQRAEELKISKEALNWTGPQEEKPYVSDVWRENVLSAIEKSAEQLNVKAVAIHPISLDTANLRSASFQVMFKEKRVITGFDGPFLLLDHGKKSFLRMLLDSDAPGAPLKLKTAEMVTKRWHYFGSHENAEACEDARLDRK